MSGENVALIREHLDVLARDGIDAWLAYWNDDLDYLPNEGTPDDPGPIRDKDGLRAYAEDWFATFEGLRIEPTEVIDGGDDRVMAVLHVSGRAKLSGVETDLTFAIVYTLKDGKIVGAREHWTRADAAEAVGLAE
jgi:ketosteroid isomerase-like protein